MFEDKEGRTEKATDRQRGRFRSEGRVPFSREILSLGVLLCSGAALMMVLQHGNRELQSLLRLVLGGLDRARDGGPSGWGDSALRVAMVIVLPVGIAGCVGAIVSGLTQTRGLFTMKPLEPNLRFLNFLPRIRQMIFSKSALLQILQAAAKVIVIVAFTWQVLWHELQAMIHSSSRSVSEVMEHLWGTLISLSLRVLGVLAVFAAIDFLLSRHRLEEEMKMSKQEVRDEAREHDGDPGVKRRQAMKRREMLRKSMMAQVRRADVVVVNPTHYAVALRYDSATMQAPQVVAKGHDDLAARIRAVARSYQVPVVHNPPLARALFAAVRIGRSVPAQLYGAVAEVLAHVYRIRGRVR